jgi:hypothetical protein
LPSSVRPSPAIAAVAMAFTVPNAILPGPG